MPRGYVTYFDPATGTWAFDLNRRECPNQAPRGVIAVWQDKDTERTWLDEHGVISKTDAIERLQALGRFQIYDDASLSRSWMGPVSKRAP